MQTSCDRKGEEGTLLERAFIGRNTVISSMLLKAVSQGINCIVSQFSLPSETVKFSFP